MRYFSMFSGIGGFELGISNALKTKRFQQRRSEENMSDVERSQFPSEPVCIGYSEIDTECSKCDREKRGKNQPKTLVSETTVRCDTCGSHKEHHALQIYRKHFKGHKNYGDATKIKPEELPSFDLLVGGFPCQAFSIAGKRRGFDDTRGTMFFEIARIIKQKQPRFLLLENVKGLLSHDKGQTFITIINTLDELGYDAEWQVLNSKNFGVPQNRERVFIIGHLRGESPKQIFPLSRGNRNNLEEVTQNVSDAQRIYTTKCAKTLKGLGGGCGAKTGMYAVPVLTPDRPEKRQNGRRFKENGDPSFTLTAQDKHGVFVDLLTQGCKQTENARALQSRYNKLYSHRKGETSGVLTRFGIRRLTPLECERLQGFPDGWTEGISDTQRYKCLGNAVTVNVVQAIMEVFYDR